MSQLNRRQALRLLTALGAGGLVTACGTGSGTNADEPVSDVPIRIGLIAPQSGGYQPIGLEIVNGFQLFLDLNQRRLGGHPVELLVVDEGETAESGQAAVEELLKQNVLALTGVVNSSVMLGIRDVVEQARVPLIGSDASPSAMQGVVYIWRTSYVNDEPGRALGPYVASRVAANGRIALIAPDYPAGRDAINGFRQAFGPSDPRIAAPVIWTRFNTSPGKDYFTADIAALRSINPAAVFCFYAGDSAVQFIKQLRAAGYRGDVFAPGFLTEGTVLDELGDDAANIYTALNYSSDISNTANRRFASNYRKHHGSSPTTYSMASYDAAQVLDKAIRLAGSTQPNPQQVNLALGRIGQIDSPRGPWQFNQPRTPQQMWYLREVRRDGQVLSNVLISELATLG